MILIEQKKNIKIPGESSLFISFQYNPIIIDKLKQCPVYNYDKKTRVWEVPVTSLSKLLDELCQVEDIKLTLLPVEKEEETS